MFANETYNKHINTKLLALKVYLIALKILALLKVEEVIEFVEYLKIIYIPKLR